MKFRSFDSFRVFEKVAQLESITLAAEALLTGRRISSEEALRFGLIGNIEKNGPITLITLL